MISSEQQLLEEIYRTIQAKSKTLRSILHITPDTDYLRFLHCIEELEPIILENIRCAQRNASWLKTEKRKYTVALRKHRQKVDSIDDESLIGYVSEQLQKFVYFLYASGEKL